MLAFRGELDHGAIVEISDLNALGSVAAVIEEPAQVCAGFAQLFAEFAVGDLEAPHGRSLIDYQIEPEDPTRTIPNPERRVLDKEIRTARADVVPGLNVNSVPPLRTMPNSADGGHQTNVITSRWDLRDIEVAYRMFERLRQENFFKYMREEFLLDAHLGSAQLATSHACRSGTL
jgi:hypothetical protein